MEPGITQRSAWAPRSPTSNYGVTVKPRVQQQKVFKRNRNLCLPPSKPINKDLFMTYCNISYTSPSSFLFFCGCAHGIWKSWSRGLNSSHSSNQTHGHVNAKSLTRWATRELLHSSWFSCLSLPTLNSFSLFLIKHVWLSTKNDTYQLRPSIFLLYLPSNLLLGDCNS